MIHNYLIVFVRNFTRRKLFSIINSLGFSLALAFCLLVVLFIADEQSFEKIHVNRDRIYRINKKTISAAALEKGDPDPYTYYAQQSNALMDELQINAHEVERASQIKIGYEMPVSHGTTVLTRNVSYADSSFFKIFSFPVVRGSAHELLKNPTDAVITPQVAKLFFGSGDPIGKELHIDNDQLVTPSFIVRAVVDFPANASFTCEIILSLESYKPYQGKTWNINSFGTFVLLRPDADVPAFTARIEKALQENTSEYIKYLQDHYPIPKDMLVNGITLTRLTDIHFEKKISWAKVSDPLYSWILGGIALLIISIAGINYVSFAMMSSTTRSKEIGIRKSIGANAAEIFRQFTFESMGQTLLAGLIGITLAILVLPLFNSVTQKAISFETIDWLSTSLAFIGLVIVLGLGASLYPSLIISRLKPVLSLKGTGGWRRYFMRPLIVLQFAMSSFLMIASIIMHQQMRFIATRDLGYQNDNVISVPTNLGWNEASDQAVERYRNQTRNNPDIVSVSGSSGNFIGKGMSMSVKVHEQEITIHLCRVDHEYVPMLNIQLAAGTNFGSVVTDSTAVLVNETLVARMGWTNPLEERLRLSDNKDDPGFKVIGVMKDYNFLSLEEEVQPIAITSGSYLGSHLITLLIKLNGDDLPKSLETAAHEWKLLYPDKPFDYTFTDDVVAIQYASYQRWMKIAAASTTMAIFIAGLGLFGLAGIHATNRLREMSIRKVLGATPQTIFIYLNKPFVILAGIAFLIATPAAWYSMHRWMENFRYHVTIGWTTFAISFVCAMALTLCTVSYFAIRISKVKPADTLKME